MFSDEYVIELGGECHFVPIASIKQKYSNNYCDLVIYYIGNGLFKFKNTEYISYVAQNKLDNISQQSFWRSIYLKIKSRLSKQ